MAELAPALAYPSGEAPHAGGLAGSFPSPERMSVRVLPEEYAGAGLAVSLWGVRGLGGILLLGDKGDGTLYGQEEIEVARAVCERLVDMQAGAELTRRLVEFQRERLAESQVADRRVRRTLHDESLPALHTAVLRLNAAEPVETVLQDLTAVHQGIAGLLLDLPPLIGPDIEQKGVLDALQGVIAGELAGALENVEWHVSPEAEKEARSFPALKAEVLFHAGREALRNAARHAGSGENGLHVFVRADLVRDRPQHRFRIEIEDDGAGFDRGSGQPRGLHLHGTLMAIIGGTLEVESEVGRFTRVVLTV
jgi:signal transduction histidine kinase